MHPIANGEGRSGAAGRRAGTWPVQTALHASDAALRVSTTYLGTAISNSFESSWPLPVRRSALVSGPKLNPKTSAEEWYKKAEEAGTRAPQRKLANEKPKGETIDYDTLIKSWPATPPKKS